MEFTSVNPVSKFSLESQNSNLGENQIHDILPDELLLRIFSFLGSKELSVALPTCQKWAEIGEENSLWKKFLLSTVVLGPNQTFHQLFLEILHKEKNYGYVSSNQLTIIDSQATQYILFNQLRKYTFARSIFRDNPISGGGEPPRPIDDFCFKVATDLIRKNLKQDSYLSDMHSYQSNTKFDLIEHLRKDQMPRKIQMPEIIDHSKLLAPKLDFTFDVVKFFVDRNSGKEEEETSTNSSKMEAQVSNNTSSQSSQSVSSSTSTTISNIVSKTIDSFKNLFRK